MYVPMTARVGAPWVLTQKEVEAKVSQTNTAYLTFDADLQAKLVTVDVDRPTQALTDALAATDADSDEAINIRTWYLARFDSQALLSKRNAAGKTPSAAASELAFYGAWLKLMVRWRIFFLRNQSLTLTLYYANIWDTCDRFNADLVQWQTKAKTDYGVNQTAPSPPVEPGAPGMPKLEIPWGFILGATAAVVLISRGPQIFDFVTSKVSRAK